MLRLREQCDKGDDEWDFDEIDGYDELYATISATLTLLTLFSTDSDVQEKVRRCVKQAHIDAEDFKGVCIQTLTLPKFLLTPTGPREELPGRYRNPPHCQTEREEGKRGSSRSRSRGICNHPSTSSITNSSRTPPRARRELAATSPSPRRRVRRPRLKRARTTKMRLLQRRKPPPRPRPRRRPRSRPKRTMKKTMLLLPKRPRPPQRRRRSRTSLRRRSPSPSAAAVPQRPRPLVGFHVYYCYALYRWSWGCTRRVRYTGCDY